MRRLAVGVAGVLALLVAGLAVGPGLLLNTDPVRARLVAAIERATGHAARVDGRWALAWSAAPTITVTDVALSNPPGFTGPDFATIGRMEASVALGSLLSGPTEVRSIRFERVAVALQRAANGAGGGNWERPAAPANEAALPQAAPPQPAPGSRTPVTVGRVDVVDARVTWPGVPALTIGSLSFDPAGGPLHGALTVNGVDLSLGGRTGGMAPGSPFEATLTGGGVALAASGVAGGPVAFQAGVADLAVVGTLAGHALPPLRDVRLTGQVGAEGVAMVRLAVGATDLGSSLPGLRLIRLEASMDSMGQPVRVLVQAMVNALPVGLALTLDRLASLWGGGAVPVAARLTADGGTVSAQGTMESRRFEGTVSGAMPDLQRAGGLAGLRLPALTDVTLDVRVLPAPGGAGFVLRALRIGSVQGDVAGDLAITGGVRPAVRGSLVSQRLDLDSWPSAPAPAVSSAPSPAVSSAPVPAGPMPPATAAPSVPAPAPVPEARVIPDRPLPFPMLRAFDADVRLGILQATVHQAVYRAVQMRLLLQDGRLRVDPLQMVSPGGPVQGQMLADAGAVPPTASIVLRAPGLEAGGIAAMAGRPGAASGTVDWDIDVHGAGADVRTMLAGLEGHAGLALSEGEIENEVLASLFGAALRGASVPFDPAGRSRVRCLVVRTSFGQGQAAVQTLTLDTSRLRLEGDGVLDLGQETMDMHLRPVIRIGGNGVSVPVRLAGPWRAPRAQADKGVLAAGRFGISFGVPAGDPCAPALAAVRQGLTPR